VANPNAMCMQSCLRGREHAPFRPFHLPVSTPRLEIFFSRVVRPNVPSNTSAAKCDFRWSVGVHTGGGYEPRKTGFGD
jgi:hypothetical protein